MTRISTDKYFLEIAKIVAMRSTCTHRKVGAVIVKDNQILSTGYNGAPRGDPHCADIGCAKPVHATNMELCRAVHAEQNAIINAAVAGVSILGAVLYCTHSPCVMCARVIRNARLEKVIYEAEYNSNA